MNFDSLAEKLESGDLLNIAAARKWFRIINHFDSRGLYPYQHALSSKSGPQVFVNTDQYRMLSSYDYLGLIGHPSIEAASAKAITDYGTGSGGVRLLTGTTDLHVQLEESLAEFKGAEAAISYSSGYLANLAAVASLMTPKDLVIADEWIHRSTLEACKLAGVNVLKYPHNNMGSLEILLARHAAQKRILIITEGIFSMDGDICHLPEIVALKNRYNAFLMVDEAHSLGVLGKNGRGVDEYFGIQPDEIDCFTGSLSKAIPSNGGFIAGSKKLIIYLQHVSPPYIFSSALAPPVVAATIEALKVIKTEHHRRTNVWNNTNQLQSNLKRLGFDTGKSSSPIIPVLSGTDEQTYIRAKKLLDKGFIASPVTYPAVPKGQARLRICATASQDKEFLDRTIEAFATL